MIRDGFYSDRLFGLDSYMSLQKAANEDNVRKIVLEFDLSNAIPSVVYAFTLKLYVTYVGSDESRTVTVYRAKNDFNWSEKSVTWDKFGSPAMEELTSREVLSDDVESGIAFSLGEFEPVNSKLILFLEITSSGEGYPSKIDFLSRNHGWNPPLLVATP